MTKFKQRRIEREKRRDELAAMAMQGLFSADAQTTNALIKVTNGSGSISELAYHMADAMLKAKHGH